ncbi:hypothetical protein [Azospirillum sp. SYSU D00513]|uniref:hypothetical protein n=1 Tax=Azospirillum sp. SYSU D00513 TaxID=2812561 RepID=UPI001A96954F|nr:hypothetical protein [Azospirillum sp. SYSU D00513]
MKLRKILPILTALVWLAAPFSGGAAQAEETGRPPLSASQLPAEAPKPEGGAVPMAAPALSDFVSPVATGAVVLGGAFVLGIAAGGSLVTGVSAAAAAAVAYSFMP